MAIDLIVQHVHSQLEEVSLAAPPPVAPVSSCVRRTSASGLLGSPLVLHAGSQFLGQWGSGVSPVLPAQAGPCTGGRTPTGGHMSWAGFILGGRRPTEWSPRALALPA